MKRIDTPNATPDNRFTEGDPQTGEKATEIGAAWLNAMQEETAGVVEGFGDALDGSVPDQMYQAISAAIDARILAADKQRWRVGSVYINANDDTNPAEFFGFGTWELTSVGQMIAGYDAGDGTNTFRPIGKTGGEREHELTVPELPEFTPSVNGQAGVSNGGGSMVDYIQYSVDNVTEQFNFKGIVFNPIGGGEPHNNMPPYVVMYVWERTA